jgi:hypothetical protein
MSTNHLIIGLGGTGGKIIRAFRKILFQEFRDRRLEKVNLGYLYVDSSQEMMGIDDPSWKILGESMQLDKRSQLLIQGGNLDYILDNLDTYPNIKPWIGSRDQWRDILNSIVGETGGQKRRLGRFLFACKIQDFNKRLKLRVAELQNTGEAAVTFHICTGLAGGTGSGSLIDVVAQIRNAYRENAKYRILLYTLLPEEYPNPNWDAGNYHSNGYAALLDLNALSVGRLQPHDVTGEQDRIDAPDPFAGCYLFTNENANGLRVDVDRDIPGIAADFLYQKIVVASSSLGWIGLDRIESGENGDSSPETDATGRKKERSKKFLAFGVKHLAIPENEIREYLAYSFTRQAALQLAFNNWSDEVGFHDEARNQEFPSLVSEKETLQRWRLTDEHLTLSQPLLPMEISSPRWKPINTEWADLLPDFKGVVRSLDKHVWLDELARMCEQRFSSTYRSDMGVRKFYEAKAANRNEHAREIRRLIESELINDWKNGVRSMHEIRLILGALLASLEGRRMGVDEKIVRSRECEMNSAQKIAGNNAEYAKIGPLRALLGKRENLLDAQANYLQKQMIYRTLAEAWVFAKGLLQEVVTELQTLRADVDRIASTITEAVVRFDAALAERCKEEDSDERARLQRQLVRFYRPQEVIDFARELTRDGPLQSQQASGVRLALMRQLGDNPTFGAFNGRVSRQMFFDTLERECERAAVEAHNNLLASDRVRLLGVNIVDQLAREYSGRNEPLKKFIGDLVEAAGNYNYVTFEPTEVSKTTRGVLRVPTRLRSFTVILPKSAENPEFMATLTEAFRGASESGVDVIQNDLKRNEITLVSIINLFPLRFLRPVGMLRHRYEQCLQWGGARARLEVHLEGDGTDLPKLFVPSDQALQLPVTDVMPENHFQEKKSFPLRILLVGRSDAFDPLKDAINAFPDARCVDFVDDADYVFGAIRRGIVNTIVIDPFSVGLEQATFSILHVRAEFPEIVFVLYLSEKDMRTNGNKLFSGQRSRFQHYFSLPQTVDSPDFVALVRDTLSRCEEWHLSVVANRPKRNFYLYDVSLSFAGEDRRYAERMAEILVAHGVRVFYDSYEEATLWGKDLFVHLHEVYGKRSIFCVMFVSESYSKRMWTVHERRSAQERALKERDNEYILPVRIDNTELPGLPSTIAYLDINNGIEHISKVLIEKLGGALGSLS